MAQSQLRMKKAQVHLVEEGTQDTYTAPAGSGANIFLAENLSFTVDAEEYEPVYTRADFLKMDMIPGTAAATITFDVLLKGSGTAGTAPEYTEALKACGLEVVNVVSTSDTYNPLSVFDGTGGNPGPSYSVSILEDGVRYAIAGAFGNVVFSGEVGQPARASFTFQGAYQAVADDALEAPTYDTSIAPSFVSASAAINYGGSYTPVGMTSFQLDLGNQIAVGRDVNKANGVYGARIVDRNSFGQFNAEMVLVATNDYFADARAGTNGTWTTGAVGSAGNRWNLSVNRSVTRMPTQEDRDGIRAISVPFKVSAAATDVEGTNLDITLAFT